MALIVGVVSAGCAGHTSAGNEHEHHQPQHHQHRHHTAHHRFADPARWAPVFESEQRDRWQRPRRVLEVLRLAPDMKVADIGSATGYFAVRLARALPEGKVYGVDVEPRMVAYLNRRAQQEGLAGRLVSIRGAADDPRLPAAVDLIFICDTYHHIEGRTRYFQRLQDKLTRRGRVAVVDFKSGRIPVGPPERMRITPAQLDRELQAAGFRRVVLDLSTLPYQYIAIYAPRAAQEARAD